MFIAIMLVLMQVSCGGGNSNGDTNGIDGKEPQSIRFTETGAQNIFVGDQFTSTVTDGLGSGSITYSSDDPGVASVNVSAGQVTVIAVGETLIQANKAADTNYSAVNDFYSLKAVPRRIPITGTVDPTESVLDIVPEAAGLETVSVYR